MILMFLFELFMEHDTHRIQQIGHFGRGERVGVSHVLHPVKRIIFEMNQNVLFYEHCTVGFE
jgi:hypothetical protein